MEKARLSFWQIWNMSFGFFGIQFGWMLQMGNMGYIYEKLGASAAEIPMLFLAAPLTGLIVQPIVGYLSDRTWHPKFGRRRPYFLIGAILSSLCLFIMPNSPVVWMAAGTLWILDSSINISMEPFRAFVADKLSESQRAFGFAFQSFFIGLGSVIAGYLPSKLVEWFGVSNQSATGEIPDNIRYSFYIGGIAFLGAVAYTVFSTKEYPPTEEQLKLKQQKRSLSDGVNEIFSAISHMPSRMKKLAIIQFLTWPGLFLMWFYYSTAVAHHVFKAHDVQSVAFNDGVSYANKTMAFYNIVTFAFAFAIPFIAKSLGKNITHLICLTCGGMGLIGVYFVEQPSMLYVCMAGVGIAWASILSMPYAMLAGALPVEKIGIYMGIFNFFIVLPEIIASLSFGYIMDHWLDNNRMAAVMIGGVLMLVAAVLCLRVPDDRKQLQNS